MRSCKYLQGWILLDSDKTLKNKREEIWEESAWSIENLALTDAHSDQGLNQDDGQYVMTKWKVKTNGNQCLRTFGLSCCSGMTSQYFMESF